MNIMSLDAEYNQPSGKTIQIGVAIFHIQSGQLLEKFETYVNPGEPIGRGGNGFSDITQLTGIKDSDLSGAPNIKEAYEIIRNLHKKHKCFKNGLVWGAGIRNDSQHIYEEAYPTEQLRAAHDNFMGYRVIDVKGLYQSIQLYHNKTVKGTLKETCDKIGIGFEGNEHRAGNDAVNSFRVWYHLVKMVPKGFK
jgi:inhibitor of KinA sporulation pathway (predicted exonuclease)